MDLHAPFIRASAQYGTFAHPIPAPYLRRSFVCDTAAEATLQIGALGFYELFLNGERITKGAFAPYISNPNDIVYYDEYHVTLREGENVVGILLGNGFTNNQGGHIWDFDKADFRTAPQVSFALSYTDSEGTVQTIVSDEQFRTAPSPIVLDDYRFGEHYDARLEIPGWNLSGFDDSAWTPALPAPMPSGEARICEADPIIVKRELTPVSIVKEGDGYRYDFGENCAGVCRLTVKGEAGQQIDMRYGEELVDGALDQKSIWFVGEWTEHDWPLVHHDIYTCKGGEEETYTPTFTYHGFRYVVVTGITEEQATPSLLTYLVMHSDLSERGSFSCSDEMANTLMTLCRRSDLANFFYFPTDCPQREKNGWTGDAALSCEHMLLTLTPETSYREWMRNICKAQADCGSIPGIVPTGGWGSKWGNGPAWDCVLVNLPYFVWRYRGDLTIAKESAASILRYLHYLTTRTDKNGLIAIGLGDWCPPARGADDYKSPLVLTDTITAKDIADKSAALFGALDMPLQQKFAEELSAKLRSAVRKRLIDLSTMTAAGNCQTSQAMALFYGIFEPGEQSAAFDRLLALIDEQDGHMDTGILGGRVLFHVLTAFGRSDLAYHMITRTDFPSYGNWVARGATSLWEDFQPEGGPLTSHNHHFWGDISSWFIQSIAGIRMNPYAEDVNEAEIRPSFIPQLNNARGAHTAPAGEIVSAWERDGDTITLHLTFPEAMSGRIRLENGWMFKDGTCEKPAVTGDYTIVPVK